MSDYLQCSEVNGQYYFAENSQKEALEALHIREGYKVYTSKVFIH